MGKLRTSFAALTALSAVAGCGSPSSLPASSSAPPPPSPSASRDQPHPPAATTQPTDCEPVIVVQDGRERGSVCATEAIARHFTVVDLRDAWTPSLFAPDTRPGDNGQAPSYRARYLMMASEHDADGRAIPGEDALGELYGVLPSLAIARTRLADEPRHLCHDFIASEAIPKLDRPYAQDHKDLVAAADRTRVYLETQLERERVRRGLADLDALAQAPGLTEIYARWKKLSELHAGLVAAEKHYVCEGYLAEADADGAMTWRAGNATELFQRRNFLMPNERLDAETREALMLDSRELDFRLALRILRERVVDAAGILEDGTAGAGPQPILGRMLDPANMRAARGNERALPDAAPDLVSASTEAAARQLGWIGPAETRAFLARHPQGALVALALPPPPAYYSATMDLLAEIDRGDIWYDDVPIPRKIAHRPTLILYVNDRGIKRPLVRWPTTIGGWADQRTATGELVQRWKESDVGAFVWRDLYAAPTWLAPPTTPDRDLVVNLYNGHYALKSAVLGPGPHAAYGMILLVHHQVVKRRDAAGNLVERFDDNGIGSHGSASVTSIVNGTSHGCHRLYNQLAVRLADFLLRHRDHATRGEQPERYRRIVRYKAESFVADIRTRGFLYELTPPVPVTVLPGNILSARKVPPRDSAPARPD